LGETLLNHSTTIGIRLKKEKRFVLPRESFAVATKYGEIKVKKAGNNIAPEYESCACAAEKNGVPLKIIYREVLSSLKEDKKDL
jgi:uncharacterized protein (DUF111 family)